MVVPAASCIKLGNGKAMLFVPTEDGYSVAFSVTPDTALRMWKVLGAILGKNVDEGSPVKCHAA